MHLTTKTRDRQLVPFGVKKIVEYSPALYFGKNSIILDLGISGKGVARSKS